jgi:type IV fimbrial biogenesis protein FimT
MYRQTKPAGFTLIELLTALAVLGVLVSLGLPSFLQMLRNAEIRAAAESVSNGLQRARAEAVSRNTKVQFVLGTGTAWTVDYVTKPVPTDPPIDSRESNEGSQNTTVSSSLAADGVTAATTITFNQLGQALPVNADASLPLAQVNFVATGASQGLRVTIGAGGSARVCDPNFVPPHLRAC